MAKESNEFTAAGDRSCHCCDKRPEKRGAPVVTTYVHRHTRAVDILQRPSLSQSFATDKTEPFFGANVCSGSTVGEMHGKMPTNLLRFIQASRCVPRAPMHTSIYAFTPRLMMYACAMGGDSFSEPMPIVNSHIFWRTIRSRLLLLRLRGLRVYGRLAGSALG